MEDASVNLVAGWAGILLGAIGGSVLGLFFEREGWLGGYGSWRRRLLRLGHVSLVGLGLLNVALALTARTMGLATGLAAASALMLVGAVTMPLACALAAWRPAFARLFPIPVVAVMAAVAIVLARISHGGAP